MSKLAYAEFWYVCLCIVLKHFALHTLENFKDINGIKSD